jgi:hypothetical protein
MDEDLEDLLKEAENICDSLSPFCLRNQGNERRSPTSPMQDSSLLQASLAGEQPVVKTLESGMIFHDTYNMLMTCNDNKLMI